MIHMSVQYGFKGDTGTDSNRAGDKIKTKKLYQQRRHQKRYHCLCSFQWNLAVVFGHFDIAEYNTIYIHCR